jgi:hypothetical protein
MEGYLKLSVSCFIALSSRHLHPPYPPGDFSLDLREVFRDPCVGFDLIRADCYG